MSQAINTAAVQWRTRPADERFSTIDEGLARAKLHRANSRVASAELRRLDCIPQNDELVLAGPNGAVASFTHYSFGQLCARVHAPADYMRSLPAALAAENLNNGLRNSEVAGQLLLDVSNQDHFELRAFTSERYSRIWNADILEGLRSLEDQGWRVPPARPAFAGQPGTRPATEADVLRAAAHPHLGIKVGDMIAPAGVYVSDRDMFAFLVNENNPIDDGSGKPMFRGAIWWNSEVGDKTAGSDFFSLGSICGNHIMWDAHHLAEIRVIHRGNADARYFREFTVSLKQYGEAPASIEEGRIRLAREKVLAATKEEALDILTGRKFLTRTDATAALEKAQTLEYVGNPLSVWGVVSGITELSQTSAFAGRRVELDRAAGKVMEIAF